MYHNWIFIVIVFLQSEHRFKNIASAMALLCIPLRSVPIILFREVDQCPDSFCD